MSNKRIAIQGILGSFHDEAAKKYFGDDITIVECDTFRTLCDALKDEKADCAVMAIENTLAGSMLPNYALMREYHLKIIGEVFLHIQMNLLALPGVKLSDIEFVISHPIAIRQSAEYLQTLKNVKIVEQNDTAQSVKHIKDNNLTNTAAVAGVNAALLYGLEPLEKRIETHKRNYTRFLALTKRSNGGEGVNKASICFEVGHYAGALAKVLNIFAENGINLTKIQSVPIIGKPYEYTFHVDIEWDNYDAYEIAIHEVLKNVSSLSILGEYKKGDMNFDNEIDKWVAV